MSDTQEPTPAVAVQPLSRQQIATTAAILLARGEDIHHLYADSLKKAVQQALEAKIEIRPLGGPLGESDKPIDC